MILVVVVEVEVIKLEAEEVTSTGKTTLTSKMVSQKNGTSKLASQKNGRIIMKEVRKMNGRTNVMVVAIENRTTIKIISRET